MPFRDISERNEIDSSPRVLIVEDNPVLATDLAERLKALGYEVVGRVSNGNKAIEGVRWGSPDVVLMDVELEGGLDGIETSEILRAQSEVPIIYLTVHANAEVVDRAKLTEPYAYLLKPVSDEALKAAIDISVYKHRIEERLRTSEQRLAGIVDSISDMMAVVDEDYVIRWTNDVTRRFLRREAEGEKCHAALFEQPTPCDDCVVQRALADDSCRHSRREMPRPDGQRMVVWCSAGVSMRHADGRPAAAVLICRDVTAQVLATEVIERARDELDETVKARTEELRKANRRLTAEIEIRREAERRAVENSSRFRALFETAPDSIFVKDTALRYLLINPSMANLLGVSAASAKGKTDRDFYGPATAAHLHDVDSRVLRGETIEEEHTRVAGGIPQTFLDLRVPLKDARGNVVGICGISRNVTERRAVITKNPPASETYPSTAMRSVLTSVRLAANTDSVILLLGESGSGKDHVAGIIHEHSDRAGGPFYSLNCAAIPDELAESELFGHETGAFTGAVRRKRGLLELAEGGTLLLNEIGELPPALQGKLLAFLDERCFTRVGGERSVTVNARILAATNRDLAEAVTAGSFRKDLFYRLNVFAIRVPALRERIEDIPYLVHEILSNLGAEMRVSSLVEVDNSAVAALCRYKWPGNVRELRNVLERALILSGGGRIEERHIRLTKDSPVTETNPTFNGTDSEGLFQTAVDGLQRRLIEDALNRTGGKKQAAALFLGISRHALKRHMRRLGIGEWNSHEN